MQTTVLADGKTSQHETGRDIYNFRCYYCHGYSGDAKTLAATFISPPPRDFTALSPAQLSRSRMIDSVTHGRPGTAMKSFSRMLTDEEIALVVDFVRLEFMQRKDENTRYHTAENGWPDHERYQIAYEFALGETALDAPFEQLSDQQRRGRALFLASCVSCHDRAKVIDEGDVWEPDAVSYPRTGFKPGDSFKAPDAVSGASPFAMHDIIPVPAEPLSEQEKAGERLFQANCAFCHGADGSGKNWIGTFMQPPARDLTNSEFMKQMTRARLRKVIKDGLPNTSMPAWGAVLKGEEIEAIISYINEVIHPLGKSVN